MPGDGAGGDGDGTGDVAVAAGADDPATANSNAVGTGSGSSAGNPDANPDPAEASIDAPGISFGSLGGPTNNPGMNAALTLASNVHPAIAMVSAIGRGAGLMGAEPTGEGSTPGDDSGANDGSGSQADAVGTVGIPDPPAPLPIPSTPTSNKPIFESLPPAPAEPEPPREVTPLPTIGTSPLDSILTSPDDDNRPKTASKIQDEVEEASRKRFLNEGGALGLRGTRGLTLARPEAFGVLRLGQ